MSIKTHYETFAAYNHWANNLVYGLAAGLSDEDYHKDMGAFFGSVHGTLNHILVADRIWLHRMSGEGPDYKILDTKLADTFAELRELRMAEDKRIFDFVSGMDVEDFTNPFRYVTTTGEECENRYFEILPHFFNHQTHHRGQVSTLLTQLGQPAPEMDFAYFLRDKKKKAAA